MQTETHLGTFEEVLREADEQVATLARRLRALVEEVHPEAVEVPRAGERVAAYGVGPKKMSEAYAYIAPQRGYVNFGFYHGASLSDLARLLEGTGKKIRHVKVRSSEDASRPEVRHLLEESITERRKALGHE